MQFKDFIFEYPLYVMASEIHAVGAPEQVDVPGFMTAICGIPPIYCDMRVEGEAMAVMPVFTDAPGCEEFCETLESHDRQRFHVFHVISFHQQSFPTLLRLARKEVEYVLVDPTWEMNRRDRAWPIDQLLPIVDEVLDDLHKRNAE